MQFPCGRRCLNCLADAAEIRHLPDPSGRYLLAGMNGKLGWIPGGKLIPLQAKPQLLWIAW